MFFFDASKSSSEKFSFPLGTFLGTSKTSRNFLEVGSDVFYPYVFAQVPCSRMALKLIQWAVALHQHNCAQTAAHSRTRYLADFEEEAHAAGSNSLAFNHSLAWAELWLAFITVPAPFLYRSIWVALKCLRPYMFQNRLMIGTSTWLKFKAKACLWLSMLPEEVGTSPRISSSSNGHRPHLPSDVKGTSSRCRHPSE